jgi:hypothetical protein
MLSCKTFVGTMGVLGCQLGFCDDILSNIRNVYEIEWLLLPLLCLIQYVGVD